jgi:retron-type reverse transcriptase
MVNLARHRVGEELVMTRPESAGKPFDISKWDVWEAYQKVKGNQGAPGVDKQTLTDFETDLAQNLYKIWSASSRAGGEAANLSS